jgi:signal transduction histidine kinase
MRNFVWLFGFVVTVLLASTVFAQAEMIYVSSDALLDDQSLPLDRGWRYHPGDSLGWAEPDFDDSSWEVSPTQTDSEWMGIGWFRLSFEVAPSLWGKPLVMVISQLGATEYYLDGRLIRSLGVVDPFDTQSSVVYLTEFPVPTPLVFDATPRHVLAVRFSFSKQTDYRFPAHPEHGLGGFNVALSEPDAVLARAKRFFMSETAFHTLIAAAAATIAVLHLLLFAFYPRLTGHLYYSLFTIMAAAIAYLPLRLNMATDLNQYVTLVRLLQVSLVLISVFGLRFLYAIFYDRLPRYFWLWLGGGVLVAIVFWNGPINRVFFYSLASFVEILRVLTIAVMRRKPYAWLIALGVAAFILASAAQITFAILDPQQEDVVPFYLYGLLIMLIIMSVGLGIGYARINKDLARRLDEVKRLSAERLEHERRAKAHEMERVRLEADNALKASELEETRKRQEVLDRLAATNQELRQTQAQLVQSEKMAALGNLVAGVAHEINTPVGAISSMHDTLVRAVGKLKDEIIPAEPDEGSKLHQTIKVIEDANDVIQSGSSRVTTIVRRLRSFARLDEAELKKVDIHEGIEDTLTLTHHELKHGITVTRNFGKIPEIACYPGQLNQVFLNLLVNARQAIDGVGEITITTSKKRGRVHVEIRDTGRGIPKDQLSKIFDPGFTTKGVGVGTGLGLSICYRIIQEHKGQIHVDSEVGKGTVFTISLPMDLE